MKPIASITARVAAPGELAPELIALWRQWCDGQPALSRAFLSYDFAAAAACALPDVRVAVLCSGEQVAAFLPFQFRSPWRAALGWAEPCAFGIADSFGIVAAPGFSIHPFELLRAAGIHHIYFDHLEAGQIEFGLRGQIRRSGLLIELPGGPDAYWSELAARDKEFYQDTQRRERQLVSRVGPLSFTLSDSPSELDTLIEQKRRQYAATGVADPLSPDWARRLLHSLLSSASPQCRPMLATVHAGSTWAASHFGIRFRDRLHYWLPVYNPELKRYAPGRLLLKAIIDRASDLGIAVIDRGEGESTAKLDLATSVRSFQAGVWTRTSVAGASARLLQSLSWRIESAGAWLRRTRSGHAVK